MGRGGGVEHGAGGARGGVVDGAVEIDGERGGKDRGGVIGVEVVFGVSEGGAEGEGQRGFQDSPPR